MEGQDSMQVIDRPARVGIIGCGAVSPNYLRYAKLFAAFEIVAVADTRLDAAKARAAEFDVPKALSVEQILADQEVELIINLTPPPCPRESGVVRPPSRQARLQRETSGGASGRGEEHVGYGSPQRAACGRRA